MKILNLYYSSTGNTEKVADRITATVESLWHQLDPVKITGDTDIDLLSYDFIFVGSGVYQWLHGKGLQEFIQKRLAHYAAAGEIKFASPRRADKKVVVYCTYGGGAYRRQRSCPCGKIHGTIIRSPGL